MNQQQKTEIGERIRALRIDSAETNRTIADYVGVSVDAVKGWLAGNGISYDNAEKVAELFKVDVDWLWRGDRGTTPDPFHDRYAEKLDEINEKLDEVLERLKRLEPAPKEPRKREPGTPRIPSPKPDRQPAREEDASRKTRRAG